jgi:hypothetical protein
METYCVVEYISSIGTIIVKGFVDYVPGIALALVVSNFALNMSLHGRDKRCIGPGTRRDYNHSFSISQLKFDN